MRGTRHHRQRTDKLEESPLALLACDVEDHVARKHGVWDVVNLALEAPDGGAVPADVQHNALDRLQLWNETGDEFENGDEQAVYKPFELTLTTSRKILGDMSTTK